MMSIPNYEIKHFVTQEQFEKWLHENHDRISGVWLKFAKKNSGETSVNYDEALDVALCYGWIDSQAKSFDEKFYLQKFTPRGKRSIWSKVNTEHVARLIAMGTMQQSGLVQVEKAKVDGRWGRAYDSPKNISVPEDFLTELKKNNKAYDFYQTLNKANVYAIAWRLQTAKKPETVTRRSQQIIEMLERGEKFH